MPLSATNACVAPRVRRAVVAASVGACVVVAAIAQAATSSAPLAGDASGQRKERIRVKVASTFAMAATLWPLLWMYTVGCDMAVLYPYTIVGLVWPCVQMLHDAYRVARTERTRPGCGDGFHVQGATQSESSAVAGMVFALGSLLATQVNANVAAAASPILMVALIVCLLFVSPEAARPPRTEDGAVAAAARKAALSYGLGYLITGVALSLTYTVPQRAAHAGTLHRLVHAADATGEA